MSFRSSLAPGEQDWLDSLTFGQLGLKFMRTIPSHPGVRLTTEEYHVASRWFFRAPQPILGQVQRCQDCESHIDLLGLHLLACRGGRGSGGGNYYTYVHHRLRNELARMAKAAFPLAEVRLEDRVGAFTYSPNHAPDVTIINPFGDGKHLLLDVTCIRPWVASQAHHVSPHEALREAEDRKRMVYGDVSPHTLIPFAVDLFGGLGPAARQFFLTCHRQRQLTQGQNQYVPWRISWSESWRQKMSVTLARAISRVIRLRAGNSFTEAFLASGHAEAGPQPDWQGRLVDSAPYSGDGARDSIVSVGHIHVDQPSAGDVPIGRNSCFGNPFVLTDSDNTEERDMVCDAFERVMEDPMAGNVHQIARSFDPALSVDNRFATPAAGRSLRDGLNRLQERLRAGEVLRLMCHCCPSASASGEYHRRCHGHGIARYLTARMGDADREVP